MNIKRKLKQTMVWWQLLSRSGDGSYNYAEPEEVKCRWEDRHEIYHISTGEERKSLAIIMVTFDIQPGDMIFLGRLVDLDSSADPMNEPLAKQVLEITNITNLRGITQVRKAYL